MNKETKQCSKCKEVKELSMFHSNKCNGDGLHSRCKECRKSETKRYRERNKEKLKEYDKEYKRKNKDKLKLHEE